MLGYEICYLVIEVINIKYIFVYYMIILMNRSQSIYNMLNLEE